MKLDKEELLESTINFIDKLKQKYEFSNAQCINHLVDLIELHKLEARK